MFLSIILFRYYRKLISTEICETGDERATDMIVITFKPGHMAYHEAKHCECWAATPAAAPFGPRKTMGTAKRPALM